MSNLNKKAIVIHSGGMDSSLCLALAIREFNASKVLSVSFNYNQRHAPELIQAKKICTDWKVDHIQLQIDYLQEITSNALLNANISIEHQSNEPPNTLVVGRNGLMAHLGGIHAHYLGAHCIYMGIMELEEANSGYRDCSRAYMDLQQQILRLDLDDPVFEIRTPLIHLTKKETLQIAYELGILEYLLHETITCYEGVRFRGCGSCPACFLRNQGIKEFCESYPCIELSYRV